MCGGYYRYEAGYTPEFPGVAAFKGRVVHPQKWTGDIDYANKRVIVIGSGATASDAGAGDGENRRSCDDVAAFSELCRVAAGERRQSGLPAP